MTSNERAIELVEKYQVRVVDSDNPITNEDLVNLDGIKPDWDPHLPEWKLKMLNDWALGTSGFVPYPVLLALRGEFGATELGMHMGIVRRIGIVALSSMPHLSHAIVLLDDGTITDGSFHMFDNGTFSLS